MKCPNDSTDLVMSERQGIEIDYCPKCRGVWRFRRGSPVSPPAGIPRGRR